MKKIIFAFLGILAITVQLQAQDKKSGAVQFMSSLDPAVMAEANGVKLNPQMLARMKAVKIPFELLFTPTHASYMKVEEVEDSNSEGNTGGGMRAGGFGGGSNRDYYYDLAGQQLTAVFDFRDTTYFMATTLGQVEMPISFGSRAVVKPPVVIYQKSDETKKILGFDCQKVTVKTTTTRKIQEEEKEIVTETVVWYTKDLGFNFSPNPAVWTEGAVLEITGPGSGVVATSVEYRRVNMKDVTLPKKGIAITPAAFQEKMEAMMKNRTPRQAGPARNSNSTVVVD